MMKSLCKRSSFNWAQWAAHSTRDFWLIFPYFSSLFSVWLLRICRIIEETTNLIFLFPFFFLSLYWWTPRPKHRCSIFMFTYLVVVSDLWMASFIWRKRGKKWIIGHSSSVLSVWGFFIHLTLRRAIIRLSWIWSLCCPWTKTVFGK